jgi:protein gp37
VTDRSTIEWTDATWNPVTGCTKVSPGCTHCYAERITERFHGPGSFATVHLHPERLDAPRHWTRPRRVFVNSMSDLFHADVPREFIERVFEVMADTPQHTYQVLTKRAERMQRLVNDRPATPDEVDAGYELGWVPGVGGDAILDHVWLGVSVESPAFYGRIRHLQRTDARIRFLSCEPLLAPLPGLPLDGISWVIVGGESGPGARPMSPLWVRSIREQCARAGVAFFFKQWGEWMPVGPVYAQDLPEHLDADGIDEREVDIDAVNQECINWEMAGRDVPVIWPRGEIFHEEIQPPPGSWYMVRIGKHRAGRILDGVTWDAMPAVAVPA